MRTLITPCPSQARPSSRTKPKIPSIIIPRTPIKHAPGPFINHDTLVSSVQIPLPASITPQEPSMAPLSPVSTKSSPPQESKTEDSTPDILAIAELFATLKRTVSHLYTTFDELGTQTDRLAYLAPAMEVDDQIENARLMLEQQIKRHEKSMQEVRRILEKAVCASVVNRLKAQIYEAIPDIVVKEVRSRVQRELFKQIPENLRQQVQGHTRQILEVQTFLCNSEARRHNASLRSPNIDLYTEPLRPLLRPLPSALQSPAYILKRPFTTNNSRVASPMLPFPAPSTLATPAIVHPEGSSELVPPTPSPLFPSNMGSLFSLKPDEAKQLLKDYGLDTTNMAPSPKPKQPEAVRMPVNTNTGLNTPEASPTQRSSRQDDINKFMNHIGLPFFMVPGPVPKLKSGPQLHIVIPRGPTNH